MLMCINPCSSIAALLTILNDFSEISHYKLNKHKTIIFPFTNPLKQKTLLSHFQFIWSHTSITYLGIKLAHTPQQTINLIFSDLSTAYELKCKHLRNTYTSWMARISLVKMVFLPKLIYTCRAIPYIIPAPTINKTQSLVLRYIWDNKKIQNQ